jgi:hypothetical protein
MGRICDLIANKNTQFTEKDRPWLTELADEQLALMTPVVNEDEIRAEAVAALTNDGLLETLKARGLQVNTSSLPPTAEAYVANAPAAYKGRLEEGLKLVDSQRNARVAGILANSRNKFTEEQLKLKTNDELEALAALADVPADFSGNAGGQTQTQIQANASKVEPLGVPQHGDYLAKK